MRMLEKGLISKVGVFYKSIKFFIDFENLKQFYV